MASGIHLFTVERSVTRGGDLTDDASKGATETRDFRASALAVFGLPLLLAILGIGTSFASGYLLEKAKLANSLAIEERKEALIRGRPVPTTTPNPARTP